MFNSIVPEGWTAKIYTQDVVDSSYPFAETIVISSPDKKANITIFIIFVIQLDNEYD